MPPSTPAAASAHAEAHQPLVQDPILLTKTLVIKDLRHAFLVGRSLFESVRFTVVSDLNDENSDYLEKDRLQQRERERVGGGREMKRARASEKEKEIWRERERKRGGRESSTGIEQQNCLGLA